ncbi:MAG: cytochrome c3 family protein [Woeseia sp.]|jgi:hypothetical protein|nr:cytochrome c3 family protein [Woeseia sp.]
MKTVTAILVVIVLLVVVFGSPFAGDAPVHDYHYGSLEPILPMSFAHVDHMQENCVVCHHNYADNTGGGLCMTCHVTDPAIWPLFEQQYHALCRDCHAEKAAQGDDGGPPRECMACHLGDELP